MTLPERIGAYIAKKTQDGTFLTKEQLTTLATNAGYTPLDILDALTSIHSQKDIETRVRNNTVLYRIKQLRQARPIPARIEQTTEQRAMLQDFMDNCPFLSDEEREALRTPFKDRTDRQHEITDTPAGYQLTMERKYGAMAWKRMCEDGMLKGL